MVYAMFSIGILGCLVWSRMMGLSVCEDWVINFTVGWEDFTLLNTFYSSDVNNIVQSAGNFLIINKRLVHSTSIKGSSEAIRGSSYILFKNAYKEFYSKDFLGSDDWLAWLIGFVEGDGAILENNGRCKLIITQKDPKSLLEIEKILGFGKVKHYDSYARYIVADNVHCFLLYLLLNGNLVFKHRIYQLDRWNIFLSKALKLNLNLFNLTEVPILINDTIFPTLNDGWLAGFSDAEGCFSINIKKKNNGYYVEARFILDQKCRYEQDIATLNHISTLFKKLKLNEVNKSVRLRKDTDRVYKMTIQCNDYKKPNFYLIHKYFSKFNLVTTKHISFLLWSEGLNLILGKQPLSKEDLEKVRQLGKKINKFTIDNNPTGHANKS
jgi:hypothetical protein